MGIDVKKPLSSTLGENPAAKTKGESRIKWPKSVASHGNALIISTSFQVVSSSIKNIFGNKYFLAYPGYAASV